MEVCLKTLVFELELIYFIWFSPLNQICSGNSGAWGLAAVSFIENKIDLSNSAFV